MNSYEWIMYASGAVWAGLGLYLFFLSRKQASLARRIQQLSRLMEEDV